MATAAGVSSPNGALAVAGPSTEQARPLQRQDSEHASPPGSGPSPLTDPSTLTTRSSVLQALTELSQYSASLEEELVSLFEESEPVVANAKKSIASLSPQVDLIKEEAGVLDRRLQESASVAKRISERIRVLDEERKRVAQATEWAVKVAELKTSLLLLAQAVEQRDWDMATMHCRRAMAVDPAIRNSKFAAAVVPTADLPEAPETTLLELRKTMLKAFTDAFIHSTQERDEKEASKFFKLFPQVGWKKEGLDVYSSFARSMVREKGRIISESLGTGKAGQSPNHFPMLLTGLFEHLAMLIDKHQPVVDRHYGNGHFGHGVMPGIQEECDRLGLRILDGWREERAVRRRLEEVKSYRFASTSAAKTQSSTFKASFRVPGRSASPAGGASSNQSSSFDEPSGPDGREVDRILTELAAISSRWGLYRRFLQGRLAMETKRDPTTQVQSLEEERAAQADEPLKDFRRMSISDRRSSVSSSVGFDATGQHDEEEAPPEQKDIVGLSQLGKQVQTSMAEIYIPMEMWYLRNSLEKAFRIDQPDLSARPYTSSILDDAFYVFRTVLARILTTSSLVTVSEMVRAVKTIIEEEYIEVIVRKMENLWRSISGSMTVDGPRKEAASREMRTVFITYLNVLDVSSQYMGRVLQDVGNEQALSRMFDDDELEQVLSMVNSLSQLVNRFRSSLRTEIEHLFTQLTSNRIRQVLFDSYRDTSYILDEDGYSEAEGRDLVRRRFVKGWDQLLSNFKGLFTDTNQDTYISMSLDAILKPWENLVLGMRFSELGALKFDKDLRNVIGFLSSQSNSPIRDRFTRLQQISYVLNLDATDDEGDLYENAVASGISWRLSMAEVRHVRSLRV